MMRFYVIMLMSLLVLACNRNRVETVVVTQEHGAVFADTPAVTITAVATTDTMLYYSRGACFGMCPIFEFTVMKDGRAIYIGKNHVDRIGSFYSTVNYGDVEHVLRKASEIGYFQMNAVYDNDRVHDLPNIITGIAYDGRLHRVLNRYKGPTSLQRIYAELDTLIEHQQWKPLGSNKR